MLVLSHGVGKKDFLTACLLLFACLLLLLLLLLQCVAHPEPK